jgi:putative ABC transport system permease protein
MVGNVRHFGPDTEAKPQIYFSHAQSPGHDMSLIVRASTDPLGLVGAVQQEVFALDPAQPVYDVRTLGELISQSVAPRRFVMLLLGGFAALAVLLATVGIYGVIAYSVSRRTHEIGVRMALGAQSTHVMRLVVRQGMGLALGGLGIGLAGALVSTRLMAGLIYGVSPTDPLTFASVSALLCAAALVACWIPARRATRVNPMEALRHE